MTPTVSRGHRRPLAVLDQLVDLFCAEGFADTTLSQLAARLRCSKSTLYAVAASKEQLIAAVVREFFRRATERVEAAVAEQHDPVEAIGVYLQAISVELAAGSPRFFADLESFAPAREIYTRNTALAADRVQGLVSAGVAERPGVDPRFLGVVAGQVMEAINRGVISDATDLDHATAYRALAELITAGATGAHEGTPP